MSGLSLALTAKQELRSVSIRNGSDRFAVQKKCQGRALCILYLVVHATAIALKPILCIAYAIMGFAYTILSKLFGAKRFQVHPESFSKEIYYWRGVIANSCVASLCQAIKMLKAFGGIFNPTCYFCPKNMNWCMQALAIMAEDAGCSTKLVQKLRDGVETIEPKLNKFKDEGTKDYYRALYKKDFTTMVDQFSQRSYPQENKLALFNLLEPSSLDAETGIEACAPGLGRLLAQICSSIDCPSDPNQILSWLSSQYGEYIISLMIAKAASAQKIELWMQPIRSYLSSNIHETNIASGLIECLGPMLDLPAAIIEQATSDDLHPNCASHQAELLGGYYALCKEEPLYQFYLSKINTDAEGGPGLKKFREHIIKTLTEAVTDQELEDSKAQIMKDLGISEMLADDPSIYVRYHYHQNNQDDKSTNLNEEALKQFSKLTKK